MSATGRGDDSDARSNDDGTTAGASPADTQSAGSGKARVDANGNIDFEAARAEALDDTQQAIPEAGLIGRAISATGIVFAIGIVVSMLILIQEIVLRYVFSNPTIWAHETTVALCAAAFIFGGLYCTARDTHIRVVLIYDWLSPRMRRVFDVLISLVSAAASAMFAYAAWLMVERAAFRPDGSVRLETSGSAWNPPLPGLLKIFLLVVLVLLTLQFIVLAFNHARALGRSDSETSTDSQD